MTTPGLQRWSPEEIATARKLYASGVKGAALAHAMRKHYSGGFHDTVRKYLGDLMPPKRPYRHKPNKPTHRVWHTRQDEPEAEPPQERRPYDPLRDNPRMQRLLGSSR